MSGDVHKREKLVMLSNLGGGCLWMENDQGSGSDFNPLQEFEVLVRHCVVHRLAMWDSPLSIASSLKSSEDYASPSEWRPGAFNLNPRV